MSKESENYPNKYTQREWDRTVGWGKVPIKYSKDWNNYEISRAKKIIENGEVKNEVLHTQTDKVDGTDNTDS